MFFQILGSYFILFQINSELGKGNFFQRNRKFHPPYGRAQFISPGTGQFACQPFCMGIRLASGSPEI